MYFPRCLFLLFCFSISPSIGLLSLLVNPVPHYTSPSSALCRSRPPTDGGEQVVGNKPLDLKLRTCIPYSSSTNLMPIPTSKWRLATLLNSNAREV